MKIKIGKSKEEKEMDFKLKMRGVEQAMTKYIKSLDKTKSELIAQAKNSKIEGLSVQYANAVKALKLAQSQQVKAKSMYMDFKITLQIKDMNAMTSKFLEGMGAASKEMSSIMHNMDFSRVQAEFSKAIMNSENTSDMLSAFLEGFGDALETVDGDTSSVSDAEIEKLIDNSMAMDEAERDRALSMELDKEIEKKLREIEPRARV